MKCVKENVTVIGETEPEPTLQSNKPKNFVTVFLRQNQILRLLELGFPFLKQDVDRRCLR